MITREYRDYLLVCDVCGEQPDSGDVFESFEEAREFAKTNDWRLRKSKSDEWENVCPGCSK